MIFFVEKMIPALMQLATIVLGKHFLSMESLRYIPSEIVERIFIEFIRTISNVSIVNEKDLTRIVDLLTDYHSEEFCQSFSYSINNHLNLVTNEFYLRLLTRLQTHLVQLDFSKALLRFNSEEKAQLLNIIGQMESIEYLKLTHNGLDDDDIRLLTASQRIKSQSLSHLQTLHLQGRIIENREVFQSIRKFHGYFRESFIESIRTFSQIADICRNSSCFSSYIGCKQKSLKSILTNN